MYRRKKTPEEQEYEEIEEMEKKYTDDERWEYYLGHNNHQYLLAPIFESNAKMFSGVLYAKHSFIPCKDYDRNKYLPCSRTNEIFNILKRSYRYKFIVKNVKCIEPRKENGEYYDKRYEDEDEVILDKNLNFIYVGNEDDMEVYNVSRLTFFGMAYQTCSSFIHTIAFFTCVIIFFWFFCFPRNVST